MVDGAHPSASTSAMADLAQVSTTALPVLTMQDDLGITYLIDSAQQFWSELEDFLVFSQDELPTLSLLDSTLRRFVVLCSTYHEQYLQSPLQLEHAIKILLDSELFQFHSERMCEIIVKDAQRTTDPHTLFILYEILFYHGARRSDAFRSHKRWQPLLPLLMDHVLVEMDPDVEDTYTGNTLVGHSASFTSVPIPIEAKLRSLCVKTLYEVCKVQTLSVQDLKIFDDDFIDYLYDVVEQTKFMHDETFNYSVIKLIIALNEQFMVAGLDDDKLITQQKEFPEHRNRVVRVLLRRLGSTKTFGENMIFMLNRSQRTPEDFCMTLLILKVLYVLFSTKATSEYFYTNDLCVLVDVFLRELADLDEEHESLRHTYLRVLHPLLTKTQLRDVPYKRPQILMMLESMIGNTKIREVSPTTTRLVERCLSGDWCVQLMESRKETVKRPSSPSSDHSSLLSPPPNGAGFAVSSLHLQLSTNVNGVTKSLKHSKSVENLTSARVNVPKPALRSPLDQIVRRPSNASVPSLPDLANGNAAKKRSATLLVDPTRPSRHGSLPSNGHVPPLSPAYSIPFSSAPSASSEPEGLHMTHKPQRRPPPAPPKRRKPPAIPIGRTNGGAVITSIRSSEPSPLSKSFKPSLGVQSS